MAAQRSAHKNSQTAPEPAGTRVAHASVPHPRDRVNDASGAHTSPPSAPTNKPKRSRGKVHKSSMKLTSPSRPGKSSMSESDSDKKKKSKLGYTRITIACSHCRRRKIRCIPAENDPEGRCQNCIKLKKECVFYAVDQQAANEDAAPSSSKTDASPTVESSPEAAESSLDEEMSQAEADFPTLSPNLTASPTGIVAGYGGIALPGQTPPFSQGEHSWQYSNAFQPILPLGQTNQYQQYPPFVSPVTSGDFAPYPSFYASQFNPHSLANAPAGRTSDLLAQSMGSTEAYQQMPMPNANSSYGHYLPSSLAPHVPSSVPFDAMRYNAVPGVEAQWYTGYSHKSGLEEDWETMPEAQHPNPGRRRH